MPVGKHLPDGRATTLHDAAEAFLGDCGEARFDVAGGQGAVGQRPQYLVGDNFLVVDHLLEAGRDFGVLGAAQERAEGADHLRGLGEDGCATHCDQPVDSLADGGVCGHAGEGVGAAAFQGYA